MESKEHGRWSAAVNCRNYSTLQTDISFFIFTCDPERCAAWIKNCGRLDLIEKSPQYCYKNRLAPTAIPTLYRFPPKQTEGPLNLENTEETENIELLAKKQKGIEATEAELPIQIDRKDQLPRESAMNTLEEPTP